jgi:hypothetical protein
VKESLNPERRLCRHASFQGARAFRDDADAVKLGESVDQILVKPQENFKFRKMPSRESLRKK